MGPSVHPTYWQTKCDDLPDYDEVCKCANAILCSDANYRSKCGKSCGVCSECKDTGTTSQSQTAVQNFSLCQNPTFGNACKASCGQCGMS